MDINKYIYFLTLPIFITMINATTPFSSSPAGNTTIEPEKKCECLDTTSLQMDVDKILGVVNGIFQLNTNDSELKGISSSLDDIKEAVQDKTCQCTEGSILIQLEERANELIDDALLLANKSANCACNNSDTMILKTQNRNMLSMLDDLRSLTNAINNSLVACENNTSEIKAKIEIAIKSSGSGNCDIESLKEENKKMMASIAEIKRKVCDIQEAGCVCEEQFKVIYDKVCQRVKAVLDKLDRMIEINSINTEGILKFLENIENKLNQTLEKNNTSIINECDCLTFTQFKENPPVCNCSDPETKQHAVKKEVKPWEISEECKVKLLCDYASCIEDAIHDLDDWFKPGTWNKMPEAVKKVMITLYCKVGFKYMKNFKSVKAQLEAGNWKAAAQKLANTRWADRYNPASAKDLVKKLAEVE